MSTSTDPLDTMIHTVAIALPRQDPAVPAEVYAEVARLGIDAQLPDVIALTRELFGEFTIDISVDPEIYNYSHGPIDDQWVVIFGSWARARRKSPSTSSKRVRRPNEQFGVSTRLEAH